MTHDDVLVLRDAIGGLAIVVSFMTIPLWCIFGVLLTRDFGK